MAKDNNVDVSKLKKFYKELVKLNKDVTLDLFKNKTVLCSEYFENLIKPKGFFVLGGKIYYNDKEIGAFKVKQFYSSNSSNDVNIDDLNIVPKRSFLSKTKDKILGIVSRPADIDLKRQIKNCYVENSSSVEELLYQSSLKYLTKEEIDSIRRFHKKYNDNNDIFPNLFISRRKSKKYLEELKNEFKEYIGRFNKNVDIKKRINDLYDELAVLAYDFDTFNDADKNIFRNISKRIRNLDKDICDKYILNYDKLYKEISVFENFIDKIKDDYNLDTKQDVNIVNNPAPLAGPIEPEEVVVNSPEPLASPDLKTIIDNEKAVREKTNGFNDVLKEAYKKYEEELKENKVDFETEEKSDNTIDLDDIIIPNDIKPNDNKEKEDIDEEKDRKTEKLRNMFRENREKKMEQQKQENIESKEGLNADVDFDSLDKRIYDKYSVSDINELKDKIEDINSKIIEKNEKIERKEKQILETEVALDNAIKADDTENIDKYTEKLEKQRNKLEELKDKAEKLENKKEKKESVISRFKDESIRVYEESEREKQEEFEKEEQAMNERLEKEAIEERDKNRKEISKLFKNASDDEISPLTYKTKKEVQQYVSYIEKLKEEGKDPQEFIDKYDKALREERKASNNLKEIEDEINSDKKKSSRKK